MTNAPVGQSEKYNSQMILDFPKLTIKIKKKKKKHRLILQERSFIIFSRYIERKHYKA